MLPDDPWGGYDFEPTVQDGPPKPPPDSWPALDLSTCAAAAAPLREWVVDGWMPAHKATLLAGDGGVGKSLAAQMMATCVATGVPFLGLPVRTAHAAYVGWEDDADELWRRQEAICATLGVSMAQLAGRLHLVSYTEAESPFLIATNADRGVRVAELGRSIERLVELHGVGLLVLDNASQIAGIDHNAVDQVAPFAHWLGTIAKRSGGAVLLLHHTNKAGQDYLGSVAYNNQFRSRLLLARPAETNDLDERVLTNPKANYSQAGGAIAFRWHDGAFVRNEDLSPDRRAELADAAAAGGDNALFLDCLDARARDGLIVSPNVSPNYAPAQFEAMPAARGISRARLRSAMERLLAIGDIEVFDHHRKDKGATIKALRRAFRTAPNGFPNASRTSPRTALEPTPNQTPNVPAHTPPTT